METVNLETLQALGEVSPEVLRALASVPVEALHALREMPVEALRRLGTEGREEPRKEQVFQSDATGDSPAEELKLLLNRVDEAMKRVDANIVMCFGKFRNFTTNQGWWNGWIDSGGGGITRLLAMPDYEVAEVFAVLGSEVRLAILRSLLDAPKSAAATRQPVFRKTANFFAYSPKKMPDSRKRGDAKVLSDSGTWSDHETRRSDHQTLQA